MGFRLYLHRITGRYLPAKTDIVLVGHSMGGILATEIAMYPNHYNPATFWHRILGVIGIDSPFLGLQRSVAVYNRFFRPAQPSPETDPANPASADTREELAWSDISSFDPFYRPPPDHDRRKKARRGAFGDTFPAPLAKSIYLGMSYCDGRMSRSMRAYNSYANSHLMFFRSLSNYKELESRYSRIRALEEVDRRRGRHHPRIRFVNYYIASTRRRMKTKPLAREFQPMVSSGHDSISPMSSPSITDQADPPLPKLPTTRSSPAKDAKDFTHENFSHSSRFTALLLPIKYDRKSKKDDENSAEKLARAGIKGKASGTNMWNFWRKDNRKAEAKDNKRQRTQGKERQRSASISHSVTSSSANALPGEDDVAQDNDNNGNDDFETEPTRPMDSAKKPKSFNYFCRQPPKINDQADPCWVPIVIRGMNKRRAHCRMFLIGDHYGPLVTEVGERVKNWLADSRVIVEENTGEAAVVEEGEREKNGRERPGSLTVSSVDPSLSPCQGEEDPGSSRLAEADLI